MLYFKSKNLKSYKHGFFSRIGGISKSFYNSLNCGYSSKDSSKNVEINRKLILKNFNLDLKSLVVPNQFHSNKIKIFKINQLSYKCDGIINTVPGVALGVLTADCCPILIGHKSKKLTGVIHAGWRGVYSGIIENFISKVTELNYIKKDLIFALGPCIGRNSYEVTKSFKNSFIKNILNQSIFLNQKKIKTTLILILEGV